LTARQLIASVLVTLSMSTYAGNFFPPDYKTFPFKEGDLLSSRHDSGLYSVSKIVKVDKVSLKQGQSISIQGQTFTATEDDFLLIISAVYGKAEFPSLEAARTAAKAGTWHVGLGHVPNRPPGAAEGQTLIGHAPVVESDLGGYKLWKTEFDKGRAGVF
jgi:hypothetical protein